MFYLSCKQCEKTFESDRRDRVFCSVKCAGESRRNRVHRTCLNCSSEFSVPASLMKKGNVNFCSRGCFEAGRLDRIDISIRFWEKVKVLSDAECWIWQGAKASGYGRFGISGKAVPAHRVSYEMAHGKIPDGLQINHKCDVRDCVNPNHLYAGTAKENTGDMIERNRGNLFKPGEAHHSAKLSIAQVIEIVNSNLPTSRIAEKYSISHDHVTRIKREERWGSIIGAS